MNRIRIGQSFQLRWKVSVNRQQVDLSTLPLHLELVNQFGRASALPFRVENDVVVVNYAGTEQSMLGTYRLTLYAYKGACEQSLLDACDAFTLVSCTCDSDMTTSDNLQVEQTIELTGNLNVGIRGRSAYEVWLDNGHEGTEEDFVAWLQEPARTAATTALETEQQVREAEALRVSAESMREKAEKLRASAEGLRDEAEQLRQQNEHTRSEAETARENSEGLRAGEEKKRVSAEGSRDEAEKLRASAEQKRSEAEQNRTSAESGRVQAETLRASAEGLRDEAEIVRQQNEEQRGSSESGRQTAEGLRDKAEKTRVTDEDMRKKAESDRLAAFDRLKDSMNTAVTKAEQAAGAANTAAGTIDGKIGDIRDTIEGMKAEGNALVSDVSAGKKLLADAITKKGVPTKETDSYAAMAENVGKIYKGNYDELFKVEVDNNMPSPEVKRIGSAVFPDWLEAQTQNAMVKDGKVNYLLDRKTSLKKKNGMPSVIDGSDGDIMIMLPAFWYSRVVGSDDVERYTFSPTPQTSEGWVKSPEIWVGATEMVIEEQGRKTIAHSCFNMAKEFRGGSNNAAWDELPKSLLGMPRTSVSHDMMRTACANKGSFDTGVYHNFSKTLYDKLNLMFMCIYGTRNWQADPAGIDPSTGKERRNSDGFKYGGLSRGVIDCRDWWNGFNGSNPFIKTEVGLEMGCRSGVVEHVLNIGTPDQPNTIRLNVPVFLGIVNPFGHIFTAIDGLTKEVYNEGDLWKERWGIFDNPNTFVSAGVLGAAKVVEKDFVNSGYIKKMDENLLPLLVGAGTSSHYCDYFWAGDSTSKFSCWASGPASYGGYCGGWFMLSAYGVNDKTTLHGGRLCFTPS